MKQRVLVRVMMAGALVAALMQASYLGAQQRETSGGQEEETYTYTVEKGDTLWDISNELYHDPWVWPKVWQWNPHITNPHWIYPGSHLQLYYKLPRPPEASPVVEKAPPEPPPAPKPATVTVREIDQVGFITPYRPVGVGVILGEKHHKVLIGMADEIYVQIRPPTQSEVGDRFFVFRTSDLIRHPVTREEVGYLNTIRGIVEITEVASNHAVARVQRSFDAISTDDKLMPYKKRSREIVLQEGTEPREGNIILAKGHVRLMGDHQVVFIDLGENQDIHPGHRFEIFREPRASSLLTRESEIVLTAEPVGELLVLLSRKETATAIVTEARTELVPGERVRLKTQN